MYSLFSTKSDEAGYRLQYFEVYNWGTFDKEVFRITPQCNTTLITGANGSGKTTYIQGLLTLIVPEKRYRFYEHQRTEESYVMGEFGDIETDNGKKRQQLREDKSTAFSILLAAFKNEEHYVTLAQARWFWGSEMKRKYIIAFKPLSIADDFSPFDTKGEWLRRLHKKYPKSGNKETIQSFDGPSKYAEVLMKIFGMRSPKALTLFDQTMRLKTMTSLDKFIRENMLEESNIETDFQNLRSNYQKLLDAHREMQKAEKQLELLKPIKETVEKLGEIDTELSKLTDLKDTSPVYFSHRKKDFLITEIEREGIELKRITDKETKLKEIIETDREDATKLDSDIRNDETGKQIQELEKEIGRKNTEKGKREDKLLRYNKAAVKINFAENPDETTFYEQITKANSRSSEIDIELKDEKVGIQEKLRFAKNERDAFNAEYNEKAKELEELTKQKNNITGRVSEIRQEILNYIGASEPEIPFIGELIQVLPKEKNWELAIEKVLHTFALRLIVPEKYYKKVNEYVNENNLRGRIVYERFQGETSFMNTMIAKDKDSILTKIEIKRQSEYANWIENQIKTNYNYICTTKEDLPTYAKAVTINGLIKNGTRHEKDDREKSMSKANYVLGWDNKEKIKLVRDTLKELDKNIRVKNEEIFKLGKRQDRLETEQKNITAFVQFDNFTEISWQPILLEIQKLTERKEELEKTNDRVKLLKTQLEELQKKIKLNEEEKDRTIILKTKQTTLIENLQMQQTECDEFLSKFVDIDFSNKFKFFETSFTKELTELAFINLNDKQSTISQNIANKINGEAEKKQKTAMQLQSAMQNFKQPDDTVIQTFKDWTSDTHKLGKEISYADDYLEIYNRIEKEELTKYRKQFKNYLNDNMIKGVSDFKTLLDTQEEQIYESIDKLNESLKKINFKKSPQTTFIQLFAEKDNTKDIQDFRLSLKDWKPDVTEYERTKDDRILENSFLKIKELIDKLTEKEDWRKRVTDVRNWLRFVAKEFYREDIKRPPKLHENIAKYSSGEQAQFTYTIMGAAIAYQYGILKDGLNTNSFRFICVDEAFARQDEEKADYLMDLVKKLNLQMLLVTPDDKIHIAEPYISSVHIVHRIANRSSRIFDTTIEQAKQMIEEQA